MLCCLKSYFTILVELIVVLVILAILAAMMVPALLGWIDEARNKQYVLEARSVYMAAQAVADELYAANQSKTHLVPNDFNTDNVWDRIERMADVKLKGTKPNWLDGIQTAAEKDGGDTTSRSKDGFEITGMYFTFTSSNTNEATVVLNNGAWTVYVKGESTPPADANPFAQKG